MGHLGYTQDILLWNIYDSIGESDAVNHFSSSELHLRDVILCYHPNERAGTDLSEAVRLVSARYKPLRSLRSSPYRVPLACIDVVNAKRFSPALETATLPLALALVGNIRAAELYSKRIEKCSTVKVGHGVIINTHPVGHNH